MKVSELIAALQKMPQDKEVAFIDDMRYYTLKAYHLIKINKTSYEYPECIELFFGVYSDEKYGE